jgi:hypothetical protein
MTFWINLKFSITSEQEDDVILLYFIVKNTLAFIASEGERINNKWM